MPRTKHITVDEILNKVDDDQKGIVEKLRALVKDAFPKAEERVRQGRITYALNGKDFSGVRIAKGHVDLLFTNEATLSSTQLKGQGKIGDPKHIQVRTLKNFDREEADRLLKDVVAFL